MEVDEHVDEAVEEATPPTKKLCSCGTDLSSISEYPIGKHLAGLKHLKVYTSSEQSWKWR